MNDTNKMIGILNTMMISDNYPVAGPVAPDTLTDLMRTPAPAEWDEVKRGVYADIQRLVINRPDYANMLKIMDGVEYNGLTLYSLTQAENGELVCSNLYIQNIETRDNDIYVDPNLTDKVVIGEDGMSLFVYSLKDDCFQIRDKASTDYVIEGYGTFGDLLSALIDTVK
ncbi:YrhA family protein [Enterobacter chuandaensis]|uniref:YrhA family protein n=1 Tax=Enterobacter chuandaensis TaxID=2497875 RepID=A0AA96LZJ2_9ENTR|nr:YrhA family protein [Enterobacter chuandaensis]MCW4780608.1 YrhA family protein [Enterobacter chuandaensis]MDA4758457.1 YrhA family protein [Enterobacter chuandaensis]WNS35896.1 YrhA family protein [Enterobacter chuandaensis]